MKILLFANTDWYLYNFRRSLAEQLRDLGREVVLVSPPGKYGEKLRALGFRWIPFPFSTKSLNPFSELAVLVNLIRLYRAERPDLAHHFTIKCVIYGSIAAYLAGKVPTVNAVTGLGHVFTDAGLKMRILQPVVKMLYRLIFSLNSAHMRIIFQNTEDRDFFVQQGLAPGSLTHIIRGSGVDCLHFRPPQPVEVRGPGPVKILFASRMLKEKGLAELVAAVKMLRTRGVDIRVILAGDIYPENPSSLTKEDITEMCTDSVMIYAGHHDDIRQLIAECDIVVLPSYREGSPRILIEAAAMAKPIVATKIAGCMGIVEEGVNGLLVPVGDAAALAEALERLVRNRGLRETMGKAGRRIALAEFSDEIVLQKTFAVYHELLPR